MEVITKKSPNKAGKHLKDLVNISMLIIAYLGEKMNEEIFERLGRLLKNIQEIERLLYSREELEAKLKEYKREYAELSKELIEREI